MFCPRVTQEKFFSPPGETHIRIEEGEKCLFLAPIKQIAVIFLGKVLHILRTADAEKKSLPDCRQEELD